MRFMHGGRLPSCPTMLTEVGLNAFVIVSFGFLQMLHRGTGVCGGQRQPARNRPFG